MHDAGVASGLVPGWAGWGILIVVPFASALYFCDTRMKTADASFEGFPGCWNMVALTVFILQPNPWMTLIAAILLYAFGSGPVRGFAVTLAIGIVTSMFTAIMLTRLFVVSWLRSKRPNELPV